MCACPRLQESQILSTLHFLLVCKRIANVEHFLQDSDNIFEKYAFFVRNSL